MNPATPQSPKLCECGCGQPTAIAKGTDRSQGRVKGQPVRFLPSHHHRVRPRTELCTIDGCSAAHHARGWCEKHYRRWEKTGSPFVVRAHPTAVRPMRERLAERIDTTAPGGCWQWTGSLTSSGYGVIAYLSKRWYVHRLMYELERGAIPDGLQIDHLCRNRGCCNPAHLEPVTPGENVRRGESPAVLFNRTGRCQRGHDVNASGVYVTPKGKRQCRACIRLRAKRARERASAGTASPTCGKCRAPVPPSAGGCKACGRPVGH